MYLYYYNRCKREKEEIMEENYRKKIACSQVDTILNFYNRELIAISIPNEVREYIKANKAIDYEFDIKPEDFKSEMLTEEAACLLLFLFKNYFADERQKKIILNWEYSNNAETTKINFKAKNNKNIQNDNIENNAQMTIYKTNIFIKIVNKIRSIFKGKNKTNE